MYEIIDAICDSVNPVLFFIAVGVITKDYFKRAFLRASVSTAFLIGGLLLVYGIQYLDSKMNIWALFHADYSTHTAFAVAVVVAITVATAWTKGLVVVLAIYATAMLWQEYHTALDIISTALIIGIPMALAKFIYNRLISKRATNSKPQIN